MYIIATLKNQREKNLVISTDAEKSSQGTDELGRRLLPYRVSRF